MTDIDVSPDALKTHAQQVDSLMQELRGAAVAGNQQFDPRAFGLIGSIWSQALHIWCDTAVSHVNTTAAVGNQIATAMREMADSYEQRDQAHAQTFSKINTSLTDMAG